MTDRELLERAAKAAGIVGEWTQDHNFIQERWYFNVPYDNHGMLTGFEWNPLRDDGEALRLAVKLGMVIGTYANYSTVDLLSPNSRIETVIVLHNSTLGNDPYAATRRAIVRAAASIGEQQCKE